MNDIPLVISRCCENSSLARYYMLVSFFPRSIIVVLDLDRRVPHRMLRIRRIDVSVTVSTRLTAHEFAVGRRVRCQLLFIGEELGFLSRIFLRTRLLTANQSRVEYEKQKPPGQSTAAL